MKKLVYALLPLLLLCSFGGRAQELRAGQRTFSDGSLRVYGMKGFGYANRLIGDEQLMPIGSKNSTVLTAAIQLPELGGNKVKGVYFYTAESASNGGKIIILDENRKAVAVEEIAVARGFNYFAFKTPFELPAGKKYYVGYEMTVGTKKFALGFDGDAWFAEGFAAINSPAVIGGGAVKLFNDGGLEAFGAPLVFADIEGDNIKNYPLLVGFSAWDKVLPSENANANFTIRNTGTDAINSLRFKISLNGTETSVDVKEKIGVGETKKIKLPITYPASGKGSVSVELVQVNGADNKLIAAQTAPYEVLAKGAALSKRSVLMEHFTTERCPNCPFGDAVIESYLSALDRAGYEVDYYQHHAGFGEDSFTLPESTKLLPYIFPAKATWAPAFTFNRLAFTSREYGEGCATSVDKKPEDLIKLLKQGVQDGVFTSVEQKVEGNKITVTAKGTLSETADADNLYITAVLTEANVNAVSQKGAPNPTKWVHRNVSRLFFSSEFGNKAEVKAGENGKEFTITFPEKTITAPWFEEAVKKGALKVILFATKKIDPVADKGANYKNREVLFSTTAWWNKPLGNAPVFEAEAPAISVDNGYISVGCVYDSIEVYDLAGHLVANSVATQLQQGLYVVKVNSQSRSYVSKIVVK